MKRLTRDRRLTPGEIEADRRVRDLIEQEKPEINDRIRRRVAEIRQAKAAAQGTQTVGQRIRVAREGRGISQVELAEAACISQGYLSQLERDEREPSLSIAARIARSLAVSLDELVAEVS